MGGRQFQDRHAAAIRCQSSHTKRVPHLGSVRSHCACRRRFRSADAAESPVSQGGFSRRKPAAAARTPRTIERDAVFSRLPEQNHHIRVACRPRKIPRFDFVTDPELLRKTGGIVQGMSGSPILQNGKLIGAVTHVFVNNPRKGYGIFIEDMLTK